MTTSIHVGQAVEEPLWFGSAERPLFGWLTRPSDGLVRGGVLCAPPIGREARAPRRAMRLLAISLAARGFVTLRFDYHGTGDSSGNFDDPERDRAWVDSVADAAELLRSLELTSISAVGMRLGATLVGVAAQVHDLNFSSMVLWDPCESGRSYLRELNALEALRRKDFQIDPNEPIETSEFVFSRQATDEIRSLSLPNVAPGPLAHRILVVAREDRVISDKLRARLEEENVDWEVTAEQRALLDVEPLVAILPDQTMNGIVSWLSVPPSALTPFGTLEMAKSAVVASDPGASPVRERCVQLGARQLFGLVSEPVANPRGPWIVLFNVANEEHTGPSRLWVELSRQWASFGLRCVRFDLTGLGDSPLLPSQFDSPTYPQVWHDDVIDVVKALSPEDPSNSVFVGLCSGAYLAVEAGLSLQARGVCAINPPVFINFLHSVARLEKSRRAAVRALAKRLKDYATKFRWNAAILWNVGKVVLPSAYSVDILAKVADSGTDLLVLYNSEDISPYQRVPYFRSMDIRRMASTENCQVEFVPGLDHAMHYAQGRALAVAMLNRHVLERFAGVTLGTDSGTSPSESS